MPMVSVWESEDITFGRRITKASRGSKGQLEDLLCTEYTLAGMPRLDTAAAERPIWGQCVTPISHRPGGRTVDLRRPKVLL